MHFIKYHRTFSGIQSTFDYYPFGMNMPGRGYAGDGYKMGFNGQERDDEIYGDGNAYTAMFWEYDPRVGRRWNLDPSPINGLSDYSCFQNNPCIFSDILGDTSYNFNTKGVFVGMSDLGVAGIRGTVGNVTQVIDAQGNMVDQYTPEKYFNFNDPKLDRAQLNKMKVGDQGLTILSDENINAIMNDADVGTDWYDPSGLTKTYSNSKTGKPWDFSSTYLLPAKGIDKKDKVPKGDTEGGFFLMGNSSIAFNLNDAGNWIWGQAMTRVGVGLNMALKAADWNSIYIDKAGPDTPEDQRAIGLGYIYQVQTENAVMNRIFANGKRWGH